MKNAYHLFLADYRLDDGQHFIACCAVRHIQKAVAIMLMSSSHQSTPVSSLAIITAAASTIVVTAKPKLKILLILVAVARKAHVGAAL